MKRLQKFAVLCGALAALSAALVSPAWAAKPEVDKLSPTVVRDPAVASALYVLMPMRV